jgi:hypothetical protein
MAMEPSVPARSIGDKGGGLKSNCAPSSVSSERQVSWHSPRAHCSPARPGSPERPANLKPEHHYALFLMPFFSIFQMWFAGGAGGGDPRQGPEGCLRFQTAPVSFEQEQ